MKKYIFIILANLIILSSCNIGFNKQYDERMNKALDSTEALYKQEPFELLYAAANTPDDLTESVEYFAKMKEYQKTARAALLVGYNLTAEGEWQQATEYLKKSEHYAELSGDSLTLAVALNRTAWIYLKNEITSSGDTMTIYNAIDLLKKADSYYGNHYERRSKAQSTCAMFYCIVKEYDQADICLQKAVKFAEMADSRSAYNWAMHNCTIIYRQQGKYKEALDYAKKASLIDASDYFDLANAFFKCGYNDSAAYYFSVTEKNLDTLKVHRDFNMMVYNTLAHFYECQGDYEKAFSYVRQHEILFLIEKQESSQKNVMKIQKQYDYEMVQNAMNKKVANNQRVIIIISFITVIILIALLISQKKLAKKNKIDAENKAKLLHYMLINKDLAEKYNSTEKMNQENVKMLFEAWNKEEMTMIKLAIFDKNKSDKALINDLKLHVFDKKDSWDAMMGVVDKLYPGLRETIAQKYPDLNDDEKKDYILSFFNVSRQEEADLLGISISVVDKLRNKTRKKINATEL